MSGSGRPGARGGGRGGLSGGHGDGGQSRGRAGTRRCGQGRERGQQTRGGGNARRVALEVLTKVGRDGAFANLALPPALEAAGLDRRDSALATALT